VPGKSIVASALVIGLWLVYLTLNLMQPITAAMQNLGLNTAELITLKRAITVPYLFVWYFAATSLLVIEQLRQERKRQANNHEQKFWRDIRLGIFFLARSRF
jgi:hypothetical protein